MINRRRKGRPDRRIAPYEFDVIEATATRAVYQSASEMPHIEFTFITNLGERVVIDMTASEATKFIQQAINAHEVIFPRLRHQSGPIGG